jgi:phenylacetate-CoA ligase
VLAEFGPWCASNSIRFEGLSAIVCSAEALYEPDRSLIEATLAAPVYNRYGCREVGDVAQEMPGRQGLVVNSDRVLVEVVDRNGMPVPDGERGELLVTDLDNYGMPFIRYRVGDLGRWAAWQDPALAWPVLAEVEGRSLDVIRTPTGERIGGTFWTILFRKRPGIRQFQVVQPELRRLCVRYVRDPSVESLDEDYFRARIAERCGTGLAVEFEEVPAIEPEASGKFRVVRSELPR